VGLALHYDLSCKAVSADAAHALVKKLHRRARALPFDRVDPIESFTACDVNALPDRPDWLREQIQLLGVEKYRRDIFSNRAFAFLVVAGRGCERATFGLLRFPRTIELARGGRVPTRLSGWSWYACCKTEYASHQRYGGFENFRRCHVSLVALLDRAAELGLESKVIDEAGYATHRDLEKLRLEVNDDCEPKVLFADPPSNVRRRRSNSSITQ